MRNSAMGTTSIVTSRRGRRQKKKPSIAQHVGRYAEDAYSLASRTASGLNAIRRLINVETKFVALSTSTTGSQSGVLDYLLPHSQGTDITNRVGDSIKMQRIQIRGNIKKAATDCTYRLLLIRDLQNAGSTPLGSEIVDNTATSGVTYSHPSFLNSSYSSNRFAILYDESFAMDAVVTPIVVFDIDIPHNGHIKYRSSGATSASAGAGALFLCHFCDTNTTPPTTNFESRIIFTDD